MRIHNVHERTLPGGGDVLSALLDGLAAKGDRLWPWERWPAMRFDRGLTPGAAGGHGPVRYEVASHDPGKQVVFTFRMRGWRGHHRYDVEGDTLRHTVEATVDPRAAVGWLAFFRPLHDALVEDSLAKAAAAVDGGEPRWPGWSPYVRLLRRAVRR